MPDQMWISEYEPSEVACPYIEKVCLECEYAERLLLTGVPVDCKRGHMNKIKSLWYYMFKGYKNKPLA
ncbi:MAG TPA: hypothetical protein VJZ03_07695 [Candidatus Bathyarchaeia archaeon]|nr:hypothetical protein [Candidatus Bathyarchaeia archaeon]